MGKYIEVYKTTIKDQMIYRFNTLLGFVSSISKVAIAYLLWRVIFRNTEVVGGFDFSMMMTYYILIGFFSKLEQSESLVWIFSSEIRNGQFTKYVVRPLNPVLYYISMALGKSTYVVITNSLAFGIWIFIFRDYFIIPELSILPWVFAFMLSGLYIMIQTTYLVSMFSFKILEIAGLLFGVLNIVNFISGSFIPLSILPVWIENILRLTPYYYVLYFPASLYLGIGVEKIGLGFAVVVFWSILLTSVNIILYNKLFKYYEGVGI